MQLRQELGLPRGANPLFDAKHSPYLVLALFSRVLGVEQKDWPANTVITGFAYYDADSGNAQLPPNLAKFVASGEPPVVFTLGSAAVLAAGDFYDVSAQAAVDLGARAVLLIGSDPRNKPNRSCRSRSAWRSMHLIPNCFRVRLSLCTKVVWGRLRSA